MSCRRNCLLWRLLVDALRVAQCYGGGCVCPSGQTDCSGYCKDLKTDANSCGSCGNKCTGGQICSGGTCKCPDGKILCGGTCIDPKSDKANCGRCGNTCPSAQSCLSGTCACEGSRTFCSEQCIDTNSSTAHCGACSKACGRGQLCNIGTCECPRTLSYCEVHDGCFDLQSDTLNCGRCTNVCPPEATRCSKGQCLIASFVAVPANSPKVSSAPPGQPKIVLAQGSTLAISSSSGGLSCNPKCTLDSRSGSNYTITKAANLTDVYILKRGIICLLVQKSDVGSFVIEAGCPRADAMTKRQDGQLMPFWYLFNSTDGKIKMMNANLGPSDGCMVADASGNVTVGSCDSNAAAAWKLGIVLEGSGSTAPLAAIIGGAVGVAVGIAAIAVGAFFLIRRRKSSQKESDGFPADPVNSLVVGEDKDVKSSLAQEPVPLVDLGKGSPIYFAYGGDLEKGIQAVDVKTFSDVVNPHVPNRKDELGASIGDRIYIETAFSDGWVLGTRLSDGAQGLMPASALELARDPRPLSPRLGARSPVLVSAADTPRLESPPPLNEPEMGRADFSPIPPSFSPVPPVRPIYIFSVFKERFIC